MPTSPKAETMIENERAEVLPWDEVSSRFTDDVWRTAWLATTNDDGTPHVVPFGPAWVDATICFTTGQGTVKEANLLRDPHCVTTLSSDDYDLVLEGTAARVRAADVLERIAEIYRTDHDWPVTVEGDAFTAPYSAPTTGPPPYTVYEVTLTKAFALGTSEDTAARCTRYRF